MAIKCALISVSDKTGIVELVQKLAAKNIEILSTGGTAKTLKDAGIKVTEVSDYTGWPEMMDGRVKTLHPKIHGGLLALRNSKKHVEEAERNKIKMIDLVVINLYPFKKTIENIDIGGPAMIRSAAKNFQSVTVVTDPGDYATVAAAIEKNGDTDLEMRKKLARKAFTLTYKYDEVIDHFFRQCLGEPELLDLHYEKVCSLRYGENPHQKAAFFRNPENQDSNITNSCVLHGKQLSFNNIVDGDSALELVKEFKEPTAVFIKHNNPCGVASASTIEEALIEAYKVDPLSAFGCVIAVNRKVNEAMVEHMKKEKMFVEMLIAPGYSSPALKRLMTRENLRILETGEKRNTFSMAGYGVSPGGESSFLIRPAYGGLTDIKKVAGGLLIQIKDTYELGRADLKVVSKKVPSEAEIESMLFANKVCKHVMSNAIVMAKGSVVTGIGAGQMSRVDSVFIAGHKGGERAKGSVMASDAFFPFVDAVEQAHKFGVVGIIQPGGSINDKAVIEKVDELGMSMVFTGRRYFRH